MAIKNFVRLPLERKTVNYDFSKSLVAEPETRLMGRAQNQIITAMARSDAQPGTADFERDLQTFRDLCALTDPTT